MVAVLCGMDELDKIINYGKNKKDFLAKEFNIMSIPSKPTLTRVMAMLEPKKLSLCIVSILNTLIKNKASQIMFDGKAIKSTDAIKAIETMMNIVTAYTDTGISLGQLTVNSKSNEIPTIRELVELLNIEGAIVTADAMHCQKETAEATIRNKGDYVLQLKANQGNCYKDVYAMFDDKYMDIADKDSEYETFTILNKGHGRIEKRTCYVLKNIEFFTDYLAEWKGLKKIFAVKREIEKDNEKTIEMSCYLSSKNATTEELFPLQENIGK